MSRRRYRSGILMAFRGLMPRRRAVFAASGRIGTGRRRLCCSKVRSTGVAHAALMVDLTCRGCICLVITRGSHRELGVVGCVDRVDVHGCGHPGVYGAQCHQLGYTYGPRSIQYIQGCVVIFPIVVGAVAALTVVVIGIAAGTNYLYELTVRGSIPEPIGFSLAVGWVLLWMAADFALLYELTLSWMN